MKKILCLAVGLLALNLTPVFGQQPSTPFQERLTAIQKAQLEAGANAPALTKFNLDFAGGTPADLVKAIEKAMGKPLNAIIPTEDAGIQLPPLKMNDVTAPQLFTALQAASQKTVTVQSGNFGSSYSQYVTGYGFTTSDRPATDATIWYFRADKPSLPPVVSTENICRFYNLDPYLNRGFSVDDITTAIQTGWKMAGLRTGAPELNYHKETKLLIAYGEPRQLQTIDNVLNSLPSSNAIRSEIDGMKTQINALTTQLGDLKKKVNAAPEEKSGK